MVRSPGTRTAAATLLLAALAVACTTVPERSARVPEWGASPAEVRAAEPGEPVVAPAGRLVYHVALAGVPMTATYRFAGDELVERRYFNRAGHDDDNRYIADYDHLRDRLIERHGLPRIDERSWRNRLFAGDRDRFGDAVAAGHLVYYTEWRTEEARIVMALRGERLQVAHELVYAPLDSGD